MPLKRRVPLKERSIKWLKVELWRLTSLFVRQRDILIDYYEGNLPEPYIECISCGLKVHWRKSDAGHYYSRTEKYLAIKYHLWNIHAQCTHCNWTKEGNKQGYLKGMVKRYGQAETDRRMLILDSKKHNTCHWNKFIYITMIQEIEEDLLIHKFETR